MACMMKLCAMVPAHADNTEDQAFLESNILAIFYHELGHAIIDILEVPIFGQEEDAADVFSTLMVDFLYEEQSAQDMAYDMAFGFYGEALLRDEALQEIAFWDVHGPDEQRYFNTLCIFYGANPDQRAALADELDLPKERADYCAEEFEIAMASWQPVFDEITSGKPNDSLTFTKRIETKHPVLTNVLANEIKYLNDEINLPQKISVNLDQCDEANAFFDPEKKEIIFCVEFIEHLNSVYELLNKQTD